MVRVALQIIPSNIAFRLNDSMPFLYEGHLLFPYSLLFVTKKLVQLVQIGMNTFNFPSHLNLDLLGLF